MSDSSLYYNYDEDVFYSILHHWLLLTQLAPEERSGETKER